MAALTNLRVTGRTVNAITFAWSATTDSAVARTYISYIGTTVTTSYYPDVRTSFTAENLPQNIAVSFAVGWAAATGSHGDLASIDSSTLVDKQAQNLRASETTAESVKLTWDNPSRYNVTGYKLQRRTGNSGSFTTLQDVSTRSTGFTDTTVSASTTYTCRVIIKYIPSGETSPSDGNTVDLDVTTPAHFVVGRPINFEVTNATLTNGVYVLDNHDDDPALDWEYTLTTITITYGANDEFQYSYQGYDETGYKFTQKWIDSDATCGSSCPWLVVALARGTGHAYFTDRYIWSPAWHKFHSRQTFQFPDYIKDLGFTWNKTYTMRIGMCLTTDCDLDDVAFASEPPLRPLWSPDRPGSTRRRNPPRGTVLREVAQGLAAQRAAGPIRPASNQKNLRPINWRQVEPVRRSLVNK